MRQELAATVTSTHGLKAMSPVLGSTMWCSSRPPRRQVRTAVPELAMPPEDMLTTVVVCSGGVDESKARPIGQPPSGASPATAMSPAKLTSTPVPRDPAIPAAARSAAGAQRPAAGAASAPVPSSSGAPPVCPRARSSTPGAQRLPGWRGDPHSAQAHAASAVRRRGPSLRYEPPHETTGILPRPWPLQPLRTSSPPPVPWGGSPLLCAAPVSITAPGACRDRTSCTQRARPWPRGRVPGHAVGTRQSWILAARRDDAGRHLHGRRPA